MLRIGAAARATNPSRARSRTRHHHARHIESDQRRLARPECRVSRRKLRQGQHRVNNGPRIGSTGRDLIPLNHAAFRARPRALEVRGKPLLIPRSQVRILHELVPRVRVWVKFLAWYEEVLGRIEAGAIVAPGEQERLTEEASAVAHLLDLLDSRADEPAS
jgi:hypothetical protein